MAARMTIVLIFPVAGIAADRSECYRAGTFLPAN